jgi:hypothetical protein
LEKLLSHLETPIASIQMGCVDVNDKCLSFLVSPKTRDTLMTCATSVFVGTFFLCYFRYKNSYIKNWTKNKIKKGVRCFFIITLRLLKPKVWSGQFKGHWKASLLRKERTGNKRIFLALSPILRSNDPFAPLLMARDLFYFLNHW